MLSLFFGCYSSPSPSNFYSIARWIFISYVFSLVFLSYRVLISSYLGSDWRAERFTSSGALMN